MMGRNLEVDLNSAAEVAHDPLSENGGDGCTVRVIGYASCVDAGATAALELKQQAEVITGECKRRGFELIELVGERTLATGKGLSRPGSPTRSIGSRLERRAGCSSSSCRKSPSQWASSAP